MFINIQDNRHFRKFLTKQKYSSVVTDFLFFYHSKYRIILKIINLPHQEIEAFDPPNQVESGGLPDINPLAPL